MICVRVEQVQNRLIPSVRVERDTPRVLESIGFERYFAASESVEQRTHKEEAQTEKTVR